MGQDTQINTKESSKRGALKFSPERKHNQSSLKILLTARKKTKTQFHSNEVQKQEEEIYWH